MSFGPRVQVWKPSTMRASQGGLDENIYVAQTA